MSAESDQSVQATILLAHYKAIRDEIVLRATAQSTLLQINITAIGTVAGFVLASNADPLALLVIPILSPLLGMLWLDHHESIADLGRFIRRNIEPNYGNVANMPLDKFYNHPAPPPRKLRSMGYRLAVMTSFGFLPAAALIFVAAFHKETAIYKGTTVPNSMFYGLVLIAAVLVIIFLGLFWTAPWSDLPRRETLVATESNAATGN
jgi:hypothetical protein